MNKGYGQYKENSRAEPMRNIEASVFSKAAKKLYDAKLSGVNEELISALEHNKLLWIIVVTDLSEQDNKLPPELKANLISLGDFVFKHTLDIMTDFEPQLDKVDILVDINRNISSGLLTNG